MSSLIRDPQLADGGSELVANILDWKSSEDTRDIVHILVQALVEGNLVALPVETAYHVFASALSPKAVSRLSDLVSSDRVMVPSLFLRSGEEALDYSPKMSRVAERAVRRAWPGPLVLELPSSEDVSLARKLPEPTQQLMMQEESFLAQRVPTHPGIISAMRLMSGPLVGAACISASDKTAACTGEDVEKGFGEEVALIVDDGRTHYSDFATSVRVDGNRCQIRNTGVLQPGLLDQMFQAVVLLVCTGNTCRSPMAEVLLRDKLEKAFPGSEDAKHNLFHVSSAGLSAFPGGPASVEAQSVMKERGLNLQSHQSRAVTERALRDSDLVLTMTHSHRSAIVDRMPEYEDKVHLLSGGSEDVSDPFGGTEAIYGACADQIETFLGRWVEQLDESWFPNWS